MYGYDNYQKIKADIENRRLSAIAEADSRNAEVRRRSKEIDAIDRELVGTGILIFKTACTNKSPHYKSISYNNSLKTKFF